MSTNVFRPSKYCHACAAVIDEMAVICPACGVRQVEVAEYYEGSEKRIIPTFLICLFLGVFGVHRVYTGRVGTGVLQLLTLGGLGLWTIYDLIIIGSGNFRDSDGEKITEWF